MHLRKFSIIKAFVLFLFCAALLINTAACVDNSNKNPVVTVNVNPDNKNLRENGEGIGGTFQIELYPDKAPNSVAYFLDFAAKGTYDKFPVSKVWAGHKVQFGDPWMSKQIRTEIEGEFAENGFEGNDIVFERGTVGLALFDDTDYNSASGDFFIILSEDAAESHQGKYAAIGKVISGIELLDEISRIRAYSINYEPQSSIRTSTVTVDLKGQTYDKPVTHERRKYPGLVT